MGQSRASAGKVIAGSRGSSCVYQHRDDLFTIHAASYLSWTDGRAVAVLDNREDALRIFGELRDQGALAWEGVVT